jgi:RNA polymerase sigma-70 factor (ECF subfamily)
MNAPLSLPHTESLEKLYQNNFSWLQNWLRERLNCSHQAADLAQDTFVRLLTAPGSNDKVEAIREPRSYLVTVAKRVMIDHFRRRTIEQSYLQALMQQPEQEVISAEQSMIVLETLYRIDAMLDGLGVKVKTAFLMSQLKGMTYREIAEEMGLSESSVKKYMAKATQHCLLFSSYEQLDV